MQRITSAPASTAFRSPTLAPADSNSESAKEDVAPAPFSTATFAPKPLNFFTVSGIAAQRVSPAAVSLRTAIFTIDADQLMIKSTKKAAISATTAPHFSRKVKRE